MGGGIKGSLAGVGTQDPEELSPQTNTITNETTTTKTAKTTKTINFHIV